MCYRCYTCKSISPHGQPQFRKSVERVRYGTRHKEISYEVALCKGCNDILETIGEKDIAKGLEYLLKCNGQYKSVGKKKSFVSNGK